jgi:hypothetical protein
MSESIVLEIRPAQGALVLAPVLSQPAPASLTPVLTVPSTPVSADPNNRARYGSDQGIFVADAPAPDPLAYYILARD